MTVASSALTSHVVLACKKECFCCMGRFSPQNLWVIPKFWLIVNVMWVCKDWNDLNVYFLEDVLETGAMRTEGRCKLALM